MNHLRQTILLLIAFPFIFVHCDKKADGINQLVDGILTNVFKLPELNPLHLHKDYEEDIEQQIGIFKLAGHVKISKGDIRGLSGLQRQGDCQLGQNNGSMVITIQMKTASEVVFDANLSGHLGKLPNIPQIPMEAHIEHLVFDSVLELRPDSHLYLTYFKTREIKKIALRLKDAPEIVLVEDIFDLITNLIITLFNRDIREAVDQALIPILKNELKYIHI